jgi:hypothetical protein
VTSDNQNETTSGKMTRWQQLSVRLGPWLLTLVFVCLLLRGVFFWEFSPLGASPATTTRIAAVACICIVGFAVYMCLARDIRQYVAEFTCDRSSLRFRKLGNARTQTRALSEIVAAVERCDKSGVSLGCWLTFRGTPAVFLEYALLPNARALAGRLRSHVPDGR